jgi:uncharacterized protein (DUF983 family)
MLMCPACAAPVKATQVYAGIATACPACGKRFKLDPAGHRVDTRLGVTFGVVIVVATLGFAAKVWPLIPALVGIATYTVFAVVVRPFLVAAKGKLLPFEP